MLSASISDLSDCLKIALFLAIAGPAFSQSDDYVAQGFGFAMEGEARLQCN